jgi:hypothetical protein
MADTWAKYKAVYLMEYVEKFYPTMGIGAEFASGLLCEKVLEGMDRLRRAVFSPRPMFVVDDKTSNVENIESIHRKEWYLHTVLEEDLEIKDVIGLQGFFEFLLDGSMILEADQMYESIPQRNLKTYADAESLMRDEPKILDKVEFQEALDKIEDGQHVRLLVEEDVLTKNGLQYFMVDKLDHLIPPHVYHDRDVKFRGRRMYLTESDLNLLASDGVNWYKKDKVEKVLGTRTTRRAEFRAIQGGTDTEGRYAAREQLHATTDGLLRYDWRQEETLAPNREVQPYKNTFAVYRVTAKFGYKTGNDPKGLIPKFCVFDIEPESRTILRARVYPHFHEKKNYFHFKLGHSPKSYYGFGYGARLINDDFLESNAMDLYLDGAALATFRPFLSVHPEISGGIVPFVDGLAPGKVGYVRNIADFKQFEISAPPEALVRNLLPILKTRSENKTSVTSLVQGRTESSDPRSPAQKTRMLLNEASVGLESQIEDWNVTGWNKLAEFTWIASYENLVYQGEAGYDGKITFPGLAPEFEQNNTLSVEELSKPINWKSQAASTFLNTEARTAAFLQEFQFFTPLIQQMANFNPELYKKYFLRWMRMGAQEMEIRGHRYLIPTADEVGDMPIEQVKEMWGAMHQQLQTGASPGTINTQMAKANQGDNNGVSG